jgi:hypothetical protein
LGVADEGFRRALRGYDPGQVEAVLSERDHEVARLQFEAAKLAKRVKQQEERLRQIESGGEGRGGLGAASPGAIGALSKRIEEIHEQARAQATRMRMKALQDVVQMSDRVTELAKLRDELGLKVQELAGMAGLKVGSEDRPAVGTEATRSGTVQGLWSGEVEVEVGPLDDFAQLTGFEDAARGIDAASEITIRRFAGGRATLGMRLGEPVELVHELKRRVPFEFKVRDARRDGVVLDVARDADSRAA